MSIYDLPTPGRNSLGRGVYGTGYAAQPLSIGTLPTLAAPTMQVAGGAASIYDAPPPPQSPAFDPMQTPDGTFNEVDPSLFSQASDVGLGGLSMVGNALDLPGSSVRDLMTWLPGGISARNPLDQWFSPFSSNNRTTGEELLRLDEWDPDSWYGSVGKFAAGTAAEIALDPLTYLTLGASAGGKGLRMAKAAGFQDDIVKVASQKASAEAGQDVALGFRRGKQTVTPRELADNFDRGADVARRKRALLDYNRQSATDIASFDDLPSEVIDRVAELPREGLERLVTAYNGSLGKGVPRATTIDDVPAELLDDVVGGNFRWKLPFMEERIINDVALPGAVASGLNRTGELIGRAPVPRTGKTISDFTPEWMSNLPTDGRISGETVARTGDRVADVAKNSMPGRLLASVFDAATMGAKGIIGQKSARNLARVFEEQTALVREELAPDLLKHANAGVYSDPNIAGVMSDAMEGLVDLETIQPGYSYLALDDANQIVTRALTDEQAAAMQSLAPSIRKLRDLSDEQITIMQDAGSNVEELGEVLKYKTIDENGEEVTRSLAMPFAYSARQRQDMDGPMRRSGSGGHRLDSPDGATTARKSGYRHMPTSTINRMSIDQEFAGKYDRGVFKTLRAKFEDFYKGDVDTGRMGSTAPSDIKQMMDDDYVLFREKYDPFVAFKANGTFETLEKAALEAIEKEHRSLFDSIATLNSKQVKKGVPMFATNVAENTMKRLESGYLNLSSVEATRRLISSAARRIPENGSNEANLLSQLQTMGLDYDRIQGKLIDDLGEPATALRQGYFDADRATMADEVINRMSTAFNGLDDDAIRTIRTAIDNDPDSIINGPLSAIQNEKTRSQITNLIERHRDFTPDDIDSSRILERFEIDAELGRDIGTINRQFQAPEEANAVTAAYDAFTNLFKSNVTAPFPSFHVRNMLSGFTQNLLNDVYDPTQTGMRKYLQPYSDTMQLLRGESIDNARNIPAFVNRHDEWIAEMGEKANGLSDLQLQRALDERASNEVRQLIMSRGLVDSPGQHNDLIADMGGNAVDQMLGRTFESAPATRLRGTGILPEGMRDNINTFAQNVRGRAVAPKDATRGERWNPLNVPGVAGGSENWWVRWGRATGDVSEQVIRSSPFIAMLKQGIDPDEAARRVKRLQVDYSDLSKIEKAKFRRAAPFYCVPDESEMLTRQGWKTYDSLSIGEEVAQYDMNHDTWSWGPLLAKQAFEFDGELHTVAIRNGKFRSTMNHRWPTETRVRQSVQVGGQKKSKDIGRRKQWRTSETLVDDSYLIACSEHNYRATSKCSPRDAAILGWLVTDGFIRCRRPNERLPVSERHWEGRIYQHPSKFLNNVIELLPDSIPCKPHPESGVVAVNVPASDMRRVLSFIDFDVQNLPSLVLQLTKESADAMRVAMFQAEGCSTSGRNRDVEHFAQDPTINPSILEAFQLLSLMNGRAANLSQRGAYIRKRQRYKDGLRSYGNEQYAGRVWCPTVATGAWVMRQHGNVVMTGNSFTKGSSKYLASELSQRPGGKVAATIKAAENASGNDPGTPDYIRDGLNIPTGTNEDGTRNYITGAGLMHEPPMQLLGNSLGQTLFNVAGMLNPIAKAPLELLTNESLFMEGSGGGGRSLDDLDPLLGRTLSNVGNTLGITDRQTPVQIPGGKLAEHAIANSPVSKLLHLIRQSTDPRKGPGTKLLGGLTGFNFATVDPDKRDAVLREQLEQLMRDMGGRTFSQAYMPDTLMGEMNPDQLEQVLKLKEALRIINARRRD